MSMTEADAIQMHIKGALAQLYTTMPAIVTDVSELETRNVVSVQPAVNKVLADGFNYQQPVIPDLPVQWPAGGGAVLTFPLAVGDDVMIHCSMSSIAEWWLSSGGTVTPFDRRTHDQSDAFVVPRIFREADNPEPSKDNVVLKYGDKSIVLEKSGGDIVITTTENTIINCTMAIVNGDAEVNGDTTINGNLDVDGTISSTGDITTDTNMQALGTVTGVTDVVAGVTPASVSLLQHGHYALDNVTPLAGIPIPIPTPP